MIYFKTLKVYIINLLSDLQGFPNSMAICLQHFGHR